jgi:hypothetical protein
VSGVVVGTFLGLDILSFCKSTESWRPGMDNYFIGGDILRKRDFAFLSIVSKYFSAQTMYLVLVHVV